MALSSEKPCLLKYLAVNISMPSKRDPKIVLPTQIHLPDGRVIQVADITRKPRDRRSYNLRTKTEYKPRIKPKQD